VSASPIHGLSNPVISLVKSFNSSGSLTDTSLRTLLFRYSQSIPLSTGIRESWHFLQPLSSSFQAVSARQVSSTGSTDRGGQNPFLSIPLVSSFASSTSGSGGDRDKDNLRSCLSGSRTTTGPTAAMSSPTVIRSFEAFTVASGVATKRPSSLSLRIRKSLIGSRTLIEIRDRQGLSSSCSFKSSSNS